jgi:hypothetical protein
MADATIAISIVLENAEGWTERDAQNVHRLRNLGEDLWRDFRDDRRVEIDLADIDRATNHIEIVIKRKNFQARAMSIIQTRINKHMFETDAKVELG